MFFQLGKKSEIHFVYACLIKLKSSDQRKTQKMKILKEIKLLNKNFPFWYSETKKNNENSYCIMH